jgi:hypothetical protein
MMTFPPRPAWYRPFARRRWRRQVQAMIIDMVMRTAMMESDDRRA